MQVNVKFSRHGYNGSEMQGLKLFIFDISVKATVLLV